MPNQEREQVEYETLKEGRVDYGRNKFVEVSTRKIKDKPDQAPFVNLMKGYYDDQGNKKYNKGFGFPKDPKLIDGIIAELQKHKE